MASTNLLVNLTEATLPKLPFYNIINSVSTIGFQDALRPYAMPLVDGGGYSNTNDPKLNPAFLFSDGCTQNGAQNCTAACADKEAIFSNLHAFHNCMAYPTIATQLNTPGNLTADDTALTSSLDFQKSKQESPFLKNITSTIQTCLADYCGKWPDCTIYLNNYAGAVSTVFRNQSSFYYLNNGSNEAFDFPVCIFQNFTLNADIGGIGVGILIRS